MSCNIGALDRMVMNFGAGSPFASAATPDPTSPALFVSNAPEQIGEGVYPNELDTPEFDWRQGAWTFGTGSRNLCQAQISQNMPTRVRVFFWHITRFSVPSYWAVLVKSGPESTISNIKIQVPGPDIPNPSGDLSGLGNCLAAAHLMGTLDAQPGGAISISNETIVWSRAMGAGTMVHNSFSHIAAIIEFDVNATEFFNIRSVVSITGQSVQDFSNSPPNVSPLADNQNNFGPFNVRHNRGYWDHSDIFLPLAPEFNCTLWAPTAPITKEWSICDANSPEDQYFSKGHSRAAHFFDYPLPPAPPIDRERNNTAAYGANLIYSCPYHNFSNDTLGRFYIGLRARNVGGPYFGAARLSTMSPSPEVFGIPGKVTPLASSVPAFTNHRFVDLTSQYPAPVPMGYVVVGPSETGIVRLRLANGGGATTPVNIQFRRDMVDQNPNQGGPG